MSLWSKLRGAVPAAGGGKGAAGRLLHDSGLVDAAWYKAAYLDGLNPAPDPTEDYLRTGVALGRNPNPLFDTAWYLDRYPDVRKAGINPLVHFVKRGAIEGRDPGPDFDTAFYLAENPAVRAAGLNPLAHYLRYGKAEGRSPRPREPLDAYEALLRARRSVSGDAAMDHVHFPLHRPTPNRDAAGRSLPPLHLAQRIGAPTFDEFEFIGRETKKTILRCLPPGFDLKHARVLDFGCGVGRVLRYFSDEAESGEFWGCEIDGPSIRWAVANMSPPFRFFQISEIPTVPLESNSFDLIYAISVFAHIHVDWHHWMAEIRRILKPGGYAFITFMAQTPFEEMLSQSYWDYGPDFGKYVKNPFANWNMGGPMAFHHPDWIKTFWGSLFDIEFIALDGLLEYQSICLMRKPQPGAPIKTDVPVLRNATSQAFDPDAVGRIWARFDDTLGYRDSYGIDASGLTDIHGWIVFRGDGPVSLDVAIDGKVVAAESAFEAGAPYRDWAGSIQTAFAAGIDLTGIEPGLHKLETRIRSARGREHVMSIPLIVR